MCFKMLKGYLTNQIIRRDINWAVAKRIGYIKDSFSDEKYLKRVFRIAMGRPLHLSNPKTYNEKLQWLKLYYHNPLYTSLVDKYEAKIIVENKLGSDYVIPTFGVWDSFDEIDFDKLPNQFVLKCTHDSGGIVICKDKNLFDFAQAREIINKSLSVDYFKNGREWPYKNVKPRIIAEQYMIDKKTQELRDYKFFVFNGVVKALFIATDRQKEGEDTKFDFFDTDFNHLDIRHGHKNAPVLPEKPSKFQEMLKIASFLGEGMPHVRIDLYEINGKVYFGEYTFFHHGGWTRFEPQKWDTIFGTWLILPEKLL